MAPVILRAAVIHAVERNGKGIRLLCDNMEMKLTILHASTKPSVLLGTCLAFPLYIVDPQSRARKYEARERRNITSYIEHMGAVMASA